MDYRKESLKLHREWKGKIEVIASVPVRNKEELSLAYTPGVAEPCLAIKENTDLSYELTRRWNLVAVVTDGTAVLGLGDIGPEAGMPVMEGKCVLFKKFADVDAFPLCIRSKDVNEIVQTVKLISGSFGGINLEDISAPRCFEIERRLKEECDIPIFHDDQHGTAIVTLAALTNAMKLTNKKPEEIEIVINGAGAAGIAIAKLLLVAGYENIILCNRQGAVYEGKENLNPEVEKIAKITNRKHKKGSLKDVIVGADVFIGVSAAGLVTPEMVRSMAKDPILFAMANPVPEIMPDLALEAGAMIMGTGRSDFPNQINNVLAFPGVFRGALDVRAKDINDEMKMAAAYAIASIISDHELRPDYIIPAPFDEKVRECIKSYYEGLTDFREVLRIVKDSGGIESTETLKERYILRCRDLLNRLPKTENMKAIESIVDWL
jgi:malate dehydrogenase (oxaloacetate-decarboxylating)